jgi:hypothetical protein
MTVTELIEILDGCRCGSLHWATLTPAAFASQSCRSLR